MNDVVLLIPARGGSKGVPGKNLRPVGGIPLVGRAVRTALRVARELGLPRSRVVVSTDSPEIAAVAREWGADVPYLRPAALATDDATSLDVALHALDEWGKMGVHPERLVLIAPTGPFIEARDVLGALRVSMEKGVSVSSIRPQEHPIEWAQRLDGDGRMTPAMESPRYTRRQDMPPAYRLTGALYVVDPAQLRERRAFVVPGTVGYPLPPDRAMDIDGPLDLAAAEAILASRPPASIPFGGREIGPGHPCLLIAEAGVNHNGDPEIAARLVDAAAAAGADVVKFQTFTAESLVTAEAPKAGYQERTTGGGSQESMLKALELRREWHAPLAQRARAAGLLFLSTPFDEACADFLDGLGVPAFKVSSGDLTDLPFLAHLARKGKPLILSTGMATLREVDDAVRTVTEAGNERLILLQCVSSYPAEPADMNLRAMETLRSAFGFPIGLSDHSRGIEAALAAAALGACVIEKHFTLDRTMAGPDHGASLEPAELAALVRGVRVVEASLGTGLKEPAPAESETAAVARKSLVAGIDLAAGVRVTREMITAKRPGTGLPPGLMDGITGRTTRIPIPKDTLLRWDMFEK